MADITDFQILSSIQNADALTTLIYLVLLFFSLWSWSIVFDKFFKFRLLRIRTNGFNKLFWSGSMLEDIYKQVKNNQTYPSSVIFCAIMQEWEYSDVVKIVQSKDGNKKDALRERMMDVADTVLVKSMKKLKYGMTFLSIVSSTSTLFGLFGTVWGIIIAFSKVAQMQDSSLVVIAPGISAGLVTTLAGLVAGIPAAIFYSYYSAKIADFEEEMEFFSIELLNILSRELYQ
jgi:biopolymer transport protein TolQ